jgi:hypothetical protein
MSQREEKMSFGYKVLAALFAAVVFAGCGSSGGDNGG